MKREYSKRSSSSRRENSPESRHVKTIGCMSGFFQLFCKYQHRRKFLTSGKAQENNEVSSPRKATPQGQKEGNNKLTLQPRISSSASPRSPTLPAEFRLPNSLTSPPPLMARLMGLTEVATSPSTLESSTEKRRQLLGALEKCDEDLKALKKIIEAMRAAEQLKAKNEVDFDERLRMISERKGSSEERENGEEQPSPDSVLDEFTRSPLNRHRGSIRTHDNNDTQGDPEQQQQKHQQRKKMVEADIFTVTFLDKNTSESIQERSTEAVISPFGSSKAMVESVNEVCREIGLGERREIGRIGLALQDLIYKDLIDEFVKELRCSCTYSLPFDACKRRLCF